MVLDDWENVGPNESSDLAKCGGYSVVLASNSSRAGLRRDETDVIAWTDLAQRKENTVDNDEASYIGRLVEKAVAAGHDESDDTLQADTDGECVARADDVAEEGSTYGAGQVEEVDDGVPAE